MLYRREVNQGNTSGFSIQSNNYMRETVHSLILQYTELLLRPLLENSISSMLDKLDVQYFLTKVLLCDVAFIVVCEVTGKYLVWNAVRSELQEIYSKELQLCFWLSSCPKDGPPSFTPF